MLQVQIKKDPITQTEYLETSCSGKPLLTTPQLNKGTAFTQPERDMFELTGKLPMLEESLEQQVKRVYMQYSSHITPLQKNIYLNKLHDTNQVLFYKLVQNHESEMLPIIYTPTIGIAVEQFSREFQQARGLYIAYEQRHQIEQILDNRSNPNIDLVVVSDGGGVLGIGDQGIGATLIPVAKLMVYTIFGGINPLHTLPILLDAGTNNPVLLNDPFYLGSKHPRITGDAYDEFIDLFIKAICKKFPKVILQWEDFGPDNARRILNRHQKTLCSFNDDIQGTGATALSALLAAVKTTGIPLTQQRIVIFGGGNAGLGIADQICQQLIQLGQTKADAHAQFWIIDKAGLLIKNMPHLTAQQSLYSRIPADIHTWQKNSDGQIDLLNVIQHIKPTALIGCSAQSGAFTKDVVTAMAAGTARPIIFPLSNPTEKAEAIPQDLITWTENKALIATGSPFPAPVWQGKSYSVAQCNNALVFPGIGLGAIAVGATQITDKMLLAACMALYECAPVHQEPLAPLLPPMENARESAREIAIAVAQQAIAENVATVLPEKTTLAALIDQHIWTAKYLPFKRIVNNSHLTILES